MKSCSICKKACRTALEVSICERRGEAKFSPGQIIKVPVISGYEEWIITTVYVRLFPSAWNKAEHEFRYDLERITPKGTYLKKNVGELVLLNPALWNLKSVMACF